MWLRRCLSGWPNTHIVTSRRDLVTMPTDINKNRNGNESTVMMVVVVVKRTMVVRIIQEVANMTTVTPQMISHQVVAVMGERTVYRVKVLEALEEEVVEEVTTEVVIMEALEEE